MPRSAMAGCVVSLIRSVSRLGDGNEAVDSRAIDDLHFPRRPGDHRAIDPLVATEPEVQSPIVLAREAGAAVDDAPLTQIARLDLDLGADGAAVAARRHELERDPVIRAVGIVAIEQR